MRCESFTFWGASGSFFYWESKLKDNRQYNLNLILRTLDFNIIVRNDLNEFVYIDENMNNISSAAATVASHSSYSAADAAAFTLYAVSSYAKVLFTSHEAVLTTVNEATIAAEMASSAATKYKISLKDILVNDLMNIKENKNSFLMILKFMAMFGTIFKRL